MVTISSAGKVANYEVPDRFWGFVLQQMRVSRQHLKTILTVDISSGRFRRCTPERHVLISPNVKRGNANGTDTSVEVESAIKNIQSVNGGMRAQVSFKRCQRRSTG